MRTLWKSCPVTNCLVDQRCQFHAADVGAKMPIARSNCERGTRKCLRNTQLSKGHVLSPIDDRIVCLKPVSAFYCERLSPEANCPLQ